MIKLLPSSIEVGRITVQDILWGRVDADILFSQFRVLSHRTHATDPRMHEKANSAKDSANSVFVSWSEGKRGNNFRNCRSSFYSLSTLNVILIYIQVNCFRLLISRFFFWLVSFLHNYVVFLAVHSVWVRFHNFSVWNAYMKVISFALKLWRRRQCCNGGVFDFLCCGFILCWRFEVSLSIKTTKWSTCLPSIVSL